MKEFIKVVWKVGQHFRWFPSQIFYNPVRFIIMSLFLIKLSVKDMLANLIQKLKFVAFLCTTFFNKVQQNIINKCCSRAIFKFAENASTGILVLLDTR